MHEEGRWGFLVGLEEVGTSVGEVEEEFIDRLVQFVIYENTVNSVLILGEGKIR